MQEKTELATRETQHIRAHTRSGKKKFLSPNCQKRCINEKKHVTWSDASLSSPVPVHVLGTVGVGEVDEGGVDHDVLLAPAMASNRERSNTWPLRVNCSPVQQVVQVAQVSEAPADTVPSAVLL